MRDIEKRVKHIQQVPTQDSIAKDSAVILAHAAYGMASMVGSLTKAVINMAQQPRIGTQYNITNNYYHVREGYPPYHMGHTESTTVNGPWKKQGK